MPRIPILILLFFPLTSLAQMISVVEFLSEDSSRWVPIPRCSPTGDKDKICLDVEIPDHLDVRNLAGVDPHTDEDMTLNVPSLQINRSRPSRARIHTIGDNYIGGGIPVENNVEGLMLNYHYYGHQALEGSERKELDTDRLRFLRASIDLAHLDNRQGGRPSGLRGKINVHAAVSAKAFKMEESKTVPHELPDNMDRTGSDQWGGFAELDLEIDELTGTEFRGHFLTGLYARVGPVRFLVGVGPQAVNMRREEAAFVPIFGTGLETELMELGPDTRLFARGLYTDRLSSDGVRAFEDGRIAGQLIFRLRLADKDFFTVKYTGNWANQLNAARNGHDNHEVFVGWEHGSYDSYSTK